MASTQDVTVLGGLSTEAVDSRYAQIDVLSVAELAALMNEADATVPLAVRAAFDTLVPALEAAAMRVRLGGRLVYVGAGTPGRIGVLDASEVPPTFGTEPGRVFAIIAGGHDAIGPVRHGGSLPSGIPVHHCRPGLRSRCAWSVNTIGRSSFHRGRP